MVPDALPTIAIPGAEAPRPVIVCLPAISWGLRRQRPQHLLERLASRGWPVLYADLELDPTVRTARVGESLAPGVRRLVLPGETGRQPLHERFSVDDLRKAAKALQDLGAALGMHQAILLCQAPGWGPLARWARRELGWRLIYDRMDLHSGFPGAARWIDAEERRVLEEADLVVASSEVLARDGIPEGCRTSLLPNACEPRPWRDVEPAPEMASLPHPVVGYFGAIASWFDTELVETLALERPEWSFVLVGDTRGAAVERLERLSNVHFLGERPYGELPALVAAWDAAMVPFRRTPLTEATDPVKVYEMLAAGLPVVATPLPECRRHGDLVVTAEDAGAFLHALEAAVATRHDPGAVKRRQAAAAENTWDDRADALERELVDTFPLVSILVVAHGQREFTELCLDSITAYTEYPNYEVVVVDNASPDDTGEWLEDRAARDPRLTVIRNSTNLGFPAACNQAATRARGEIFCLLNNDTVVTRGWLGALVAALERDPEVGIVGPSSNGVANEARVRPECSSLEELPDWAERRRRQLFGRQFSIPMVALCCAVIRRDLWESLGGLDEAFGPGLFEDDDLAHRVRDAGFDVRCLRDAYVHHWQGVTFGAMPSEEHQEIYERNRRLLADKTAANRWRPRLAEHTYDTERDRAGVGSSVRELLRYRDFVRLLVVANLTARYKRSVLGVAWTLLNPLLTMAVMTFAFSALFRRQVDHYPVYVLSGLILWQFFALTTTHSMNQLASGNSLLRRIYVPALAFPVAAVVTGLINAMISIIPLAAIMVLLGHPFSVALVTLPVTLGITAVFILGVSLVLSTVAVFFTDVTEMYGAVLRLWFYLTPVMYPEDILPRSFQRFLALNPVYHLLSSWRAPIYSGTVPSLSNILVGGAWATVALVVGLVVFSRFEPEFSLRA